MSVRIFPYSTMRTEMVLTARVRNVEADPETGMIPVWEHPDVVRDGAIVTVQVTATPTDVDEMERMHADLEVTLVVQCGPTKYRFARELKRDDSYNWSGSFWLDCKQISGSAVLEAIASGVVGRRRRRLLGASQPISVAVDPPRSIARKGELSIRWKDFSELPQLADFVDEPYWLDLNEVPAPVLYLNLRIRDLPRVLPDSGLPPKPLRPLYESIRTGIARSAWMSLFNASLSGIEETEGDEAPAPPTTDWQAEVLARILPAVYPDASAEEILGNALRARDDEVYGRELQSRAALVIERDLVRDGTAIRRALRDIDELLETGVPR